jgi:acetyl esterase/lipase
MMRDDKTMSIFHPDLYPAARFLPRSVNPALIVRMQRWREWLCGTSKAPKIPVVDGVAVKDFAVAGMEGTASIRVRVYRPPAAQNPVPAMLWIHGGGFIMGDSEIDQVNNIALVRELGIAVASVNYRLAPRHPYPAPIEDCYAALQWLHAQAGELGIAPGRIAIGGNSAGGGLAAGLVLLAHDRQEVPVAFQLLIYPMLDDRTATRADIDTTNARLWDNECNRYGWASYLNTAPGSPDVRAYAAPARRKNLAGLPPAWIGVGTYDLFYQEDCLYAKRLAESGVGCELRVVERAYHGFDLFTRRASVVKEFRQSYVDALRRCLFA